MPDCPPVIVHIHVPKTAGSSFRSMLEKRFGGDHANLYVDNTWFVYDEEYLDKFIAERPNLRSISSHFIRTFPPRLGGRPVVYVTFLRDPVDQLISYLTYTRKFFRQIPDQDLLACLPPRADEIPLREMARWVLSQDREIPFRENYVTGYFARYVVGAVGAPTSGDEYNRSRLLAAKLALRDFLVVGITERMQASVDLVPRVAERSGIEVPQGTIAVENVSSEHRDGLEWTDPADEVGAMLHRSVAEDRALYEWAATHWSPYGEK